MAGRGPGLGILAGAAAGICGLAAIAPFTDGAPTETEEDAAAIAGRAAKSPPPRTDGRLPDWGESVAANRAESQPMPPSMAPATRATTHMAINRYPRYSNHLPTGLLAPRLTSSKASLRGRTRKNMTAARPAPRGQM